MKRYATILKKVTQDEVINPVRKSLTEEQAYAEAFRVEIWHVHGLALHLDKYISNPLKRVNKHSNLDVDVYRHYVWACQKANVKQSIVMVKTVPGLLGIPVLHGFNEVVSKYGNLVNAPIIRHRIITTEEMEAINLNRESRRLKPLVVIDVEPSPNVPDGEYFHRHLKLVDPHVLVTDAKDLYDDERRFVRLFKKKRVDVKHPWFSLSPEQRAFYRGLYGKNVEDRREFLEEIGISNVIKYMDGKLLDIDSTKHNGTRALYELHGPANALVVSCSTTTRVYLIWVPKSVKTCQEADSTISSQAPQDKCIGAA